MIARLKNRWRQQRGNAVLISLIIMASALSTSLGLASVVTSEVRNVGLVPASERAYYKAESYLEQALWEKNKKDVNYNVNAEQLGSIQGVPYVCTTSPCFTATSDLDSRDPTKFLKSFLASSIPQDPAGYTLFRDKTAQFDLGTQGVSGTATMTLGPVTPVPPAPTVSNVKIEVTIVAFPTDATNVPNITSPEATGLNPLAGGTPVFIDKVLVNAANPAPITLGGGGGIGGVNSLGETYPSFSNNTYRIRLKALGGDATVKPDVTAGNVKLPLQSTDFTVRAVAQDGKAQRGIQVVNPTTTQAAGIFDYALFADLNLEKLNAKQPASTVQSSIRAPVKVVNSCSASDEKDVESADQNKTNKLTVTAASGPEQFPVPVGGGSSAIIGGLTLNATYTVTATSPEAWYQICTGPQTVTATNGQVSTPTFRVVKTHGDGVWALSFRGDVFAGGLTWSSSFDSVINFSRFSSWLGDRVGLPGNTNPYASSIWQGKIRATTAGSYNFCLDLDDGASVVINGATIMASYGQGAAFRCASATLNAGWENTLIIYYLNLNVPGQSAIHFYYTGPDTGGVQTLVPADRLRHAVDYTHYPAYRSRNFCGGVDYYATASGSEYNINNSGGCWIGEGPDGYVYLYPVPGSVPLYRSYHPGLTSHAYSLDPNLGPSGGFSREGILGYAYGDYAGIPTLVSWHQYYSPPWTAHYYTINRNDAGLSACCAFNYDGVAATLFPN